MFKSFRTLLKQGNSIGPYLSMQGALPVHVLNHGIIVRPRLGPFSAKSVEALLLYLVKLISYVDTAIIMTDCAMC